MDELSELDHIRISNRGDGFQNTRSEQPGSLKYTNKVSLFLTKNWSTTRTTLSTSAQKSKFLTSIKFSKQNLMRILENWT